MDVIKFNNPNNPTKMEQGEIINNLHSKLWVEKYNVAGEFEFVAKVSTGMKEKLPIGTFVSHVDTPEIMIVENHEISEEKKNVEPDIKITGRSFPSFFENRLTANWGPDDVPANLSNSYLASEWPWNQAVVLIKSQIIAADMQDPAGALAYFAVDAYTQDVDESIDRFLPIEDLYTGLTKFFASNNLGIKTIRPGKPRVLSGAPVAPEETLIRVYRGVDRSDEIIFSHATGEIETADYLWSNKKLKNAVSIRGKWIETAIFPTETGIERRWMIIDASDLDEHFPDYDTAAADLDLPAYMQERGQQALAAQNEITLVKAEVSQSANKATYRKDFDVGDIITVDGNYNEISKMRVTEYVEIEDENGQKGYPTLSLA